MTDNASNNLPEIILTRPKEGARKFHALIQEKLPEAKVIISPLITIDFLPKSIDFTKFDTFIFTSINGVQAIENQRIPHGTLCFAVGAKTAHAAGKIGFKALYSDGNSEDLISIILSHPRRGKFLHIRGKYTRGDVSRKLSEHGLPCEEIVAYHQKSQALTHEAQSSMKGGKPLIFPLFSPRTAQLLMENILPMERCHIIAMSENISEAFKKTGCGKITTSKSPSAKSMLEEVIKIYNMISHLERLSGQK